MRFKINNQNFALAVSHAQTLSGLGASSGIRQTTSITYSSILVEADESGTVTFTSENQFGAGFRSQAEADVETPGKAMIDMGELATVLSVFPSSSNVEVASVANDNDKIYEVQVSDGEGLEATAIAHSVTDRDSAPRMKDVGNDDAATFFIALDKFQSVWGTGSACVAPPNDGSQLMSHVYICFDNDNMNIQSTDKKSFSFANGEGESDGDMFYGMVRPENMNRVMSILGSAGVSDILFQSIRPEGIDGVADRAFAVKGYTKNDDGESKLAVEIRFPLGNIDSSDAFHKGTILKQICKRLESPVADVFAKRDNLNSAMGKASKICSLIPNETGGPAKEIAVTFNPEGADISLPKGRFEGHLPLETSIHEGNGKKLNAKLKWGFVSDLVASTPPSDEVNIRVFGAGDKNLAMCLYENDDWGEGSTTPESWMILFSSPRK